MVSEEISFVGINGVGGDFLRARRSDDLPGFNLSPEQVLAAMDHGEDVKVIGLGQVDDAIALEDELPDIIAIGFGNASPDVRVVGQLLYRGDHFGGEAPGVIRRVFGDIVSETMQIGSSALPPNPHRPAARLSPAREGPCAPPRCH